MARKVIPLKRAISQVPSPAIQPDAQPTPRRFTVVPPPKESTGFIPPKGPPAVRSARELEEERRKQKSAENADAFKMYEAIPVDDLGRSRGVMMDEDPEMASFIPMLQEYLRSRCDGVFPG